VPGAESAARVYELSVGGEKVCRTRWSRLHWYIPGVLDRIKES
jgi:hypothetical protein